MKKSIKQYVVAVVLGLGIVLGVGSLQAQWTAPSATPPDGNVPAPLNTGNSSQSKLGQLIVNTNTTSNGPGPFAVGLSVFGKTILNGGVQIPAGAGDNKVLTSDASGNGTWQDATGGVGGGSGTWGRIYTYRTAIDFNNGVSDWITISLPNGDTMTAASLRYGGRDNYLYDTPTQLSSFDDAQSYIEINTAESKLRVHLLNTDHVTPNTTYDSGTYFNYVYLNIYTGSPGGSSGTPTGTIRGYGTGAYAYSTQANTSCTAVSAPFSCSGVSPVCESGWSVISAGNQYGSCAGSTCSKIYMCVKN
ncbi:MAG: hypothetical protein AAB917_02165 [Patescibacteria group bacterium]